MTDFWSLWIIILTSITIIGVTGVLFANRSIDGTETDQTTGHIYDGIEEYDNPLPAWWFNLFVVTIIFAIIYLILYPGMGTYKGLLGWTQVSQWQEQVDEGEQAFLANAKEYYNTPAADLVDDYSAIRMGKRLFKSNCATCHGNDATGSHAFPNLADNDWLYGGTEEAIKKSIHDGRIGAMPGWKAILGRDTDAMVDYVKYMGSMSDTERQEHSMHDKFVALCGSCHGADGKGNHVFGAPNLTDDIWLYGSSSGRIKITLESGRNGRMPAHKELLTKERIHLITAYILSLSYKPK